MESWNDKLWMFAVWLVATTTPWLSMWMCFCMPCCGHTTLPLCQLQLPSGPSEHIVCCWNICIICCDMVWELCLHMFVSHGKWMHRAELLLDLGLSMPSPPSLERARPGCMQTNRMPDAWMPDKQNGGLDAWKKTEAWMPAKKRRPGCLTKKKCMQMDYTRVIPVLYRSIPYYTV